jgi:hypothetical protein
MARKVSRRAQVGRAIRRAEAGALPDFVPPQLTALTETAPEGAEWIHELKWDGYRMHARIDGEDVRLLTRTGLDWTDNYPAIVDALRALPVTQAQPVQQAGRRHAVCSSNAVRMSERSRIPEAGLHLPGGPHERHPTSGACIASVYRARQEFLPCQGVACCDTLGAMDKTSSPHG